jgi:DeoR family transcriptional regulator of aga operon
VRYEVLKNLTDITNAVNIAAELSATTLDVILTGGTLRKNSFSRVGGRNLALLNADILFLGVDGFDVHYELSTPNLLESKVNRAMLEIARRRIAVCDSSKFGRRSLSLIAPISALHEVITDHGAPKSDVSMLKKSGLEVELVWSR